MNLRRFLLFCFIPVLSSCTEEASIPRPRGYFRIDLPEKSYQAYQTDCPFSFEIPDYAIMSPGSAGDSEPCWLNLQFPKQRATLHLSYKDIETDAAQLMEDSRTMAYKHAVKANGIEEKVFENPEDNVFGIMYKINGNAASSVQFYTTDNTAHFLRGSLYFYSSPNADSLQPVMDFIREDIEHLVSTLKWK
jgi:gliding motility-associated lipoprotein GldD